MPSEQDEGRAIWQDAGTLNWVDSAEADVQSGVHNPLLEDQTATDDLQGPDTESDVLSWTRQPLLNGEAVGTFARQFSPIWVPLLSALLLFFLGRLLPTTFLPALFGALLLLILALVEGSLLYLAGSNDTLWLLYLAGGSALLLLGGAFATFGWGITLATLVVLILIGAILAQRAIHPTKEGYVDLVERFGKYTHTFYPGLNLLLPWEKISCRLNTQETVWTTPLQQVPTSRDQEVQLTATVSYQLIAEDAHLAAVMVKNWEASLQALFVGTLQSVVNELSPQDFVDWTQSMYTRPPNESLSFNPASVTRWDQINTALSRRLQDQIAPWGVQVNWVRIQDLTMLPHTSGAHLPLHEHTTARTAKPVSAPVTTPAPQAVEKAEAAPAPAPDAAATPAPKVAVPASKAASVETLVEAYNAVRQGSITDPGTILEIAQRFEELARDPVLNQTITFDAGRAAATLRERSQKLAQTRANMSVGVQHQES